MGGCIFGNTALAALHARAAHGVERIAIVDWDAHHGNGTQAAFWDDPSVLTISLHQAGCFPPGSGAVDELGGAGAQARTSTSRCLRALASARSRPPSTTSCCRRSSASPPARADRVRLRLAAPWDAHAR